MIQDLCRSATGSRCQQPRLSNWKLVSPSQSNISIDVADAATGGAGAVIPVNVKVYGSYFLTGLENDGIGLSSQGYGVGAGAGAGWGIPFIGARAVGRVPEGIKRELLKRIGGAVQGKVIDMVKGLADFGVSGGTQMITGPDAPSCELAPRDFHDCWATIFSFGANFVVNGVNVGMVTFSRNRPVIGMEDLVYAKAFGLIAGVGLATSLDLEASGMAYRTSFR